MRKRIALWLIAGLALLLLGGVAWAASSAGIQRQAVSAGGGARTSAGYAARDTTGQSAIGVAQGSDSRVRAGFWAGPAPAPLAGNGTLIGQVLLQARSDHSGVSVGVGDYVAITDVAGNFTIPDLPSGSYTVSVSVAGFLGVERPGVPVMAGKTTTLPPLVLLWGDANGDGVINIFDLVLVGVNFNMASSPWAGEPTVD